MRKYILLSCLWAGSLLATASDSGKDKKLFIGINFASGVGYRTLHLSDGSNGRAASYDYFKKYDKPIFGYNLGVDLTYRFSHLVGLQTGAIYSMKGLSYAAPILFVSNSGATSTGTSTVIYRFHFVDIPLVAKLYAGKGKVQFIGGAGGQFDFLFGQQNIGKIDKAGHQVYRDAHTYLPAPKGPNIFTMSALASAGLDYRINGRMGVRAEPYFSHGFIPFASNGIKTYLWNAGINCAFYFGVK